MKIINVGSVKISNNLPFALIAGPCSLESRDTSLKIADHLCDISYKLNIPYIFKASFDKANRTSINAKRGIDFHESLKIFEEIKSKFGCPVLTDVHTAEQCSILSEVVDVLQIPAFLCRQTDLLVAAAKTQKVINIKKGQFLAPWDMKNVCEKVSSSGNDNILLCERGTCFGYNRLITDFRALKIMEQLEYPVIFDATHSVQEPGGLGSCSSGNRDHVELLARAATSIGVAGIFIETHFDPNNAFSDGPNMVPLKNMYGLLETLKTFDTLSKSTLYQNMSC